MKKQYIKSRTNELISSKLFRATGLGLSLFASSIATSQAFGQTALNVPMNGQWTNVPGVTAGAVSGAFGGGAFGGTAIPGYQPVNVQYGAVGGQQLVAPQMATSQMIAPSAGLPTIGVSTANVATGAYTGPVYNLPSVQAAQRLPAETLNGPIVSSISTPVVTKSMDVVVPSAVVTPPAPMKVVAPVVETQEIKVEQRTFRAATPGDFYLGAKAFVQDPDTFTWDSDSTSSGADHVVTQMDDGRSLLLVAGVPLNMGLPVSGINIEGEAGYRLARVSGMTSNASGSITDPNGKLKILSGAVNLVKEFKTASNWGGYIGGGLGLAELEHDNFSAASGLPNTMTDDDINLMLNSFGGLSYQLNPTTKLLAEVRRTLFPDVNRIADDGSLLDDTYSINEGGLGIKVGF